MRVRAQTREPHSAKTTVSAIGRNILPSIPRSARIGRYTMMIMPTAKATGRATSWQAARTFSKCGRSSSLRSCRKRTMFSIMTTEPSTIRPKSIAPRLIRFPLSPANRMAVKATNIDRGMAEATINPPRRLPSNRSSTTMTRRPPSARFVATVRIVSLTRSVRS